MTPHVSTKRWTLSDLEVTDDAIRVWLSDGRAVAVPLSWYPQLCDATADERNHWKLEDDGTAVRWPDLDEDVSVAGLVTGSSGESAASLGEWLLARQQGRGVLGFELAAWQQAHRIAALSPGRS